MEEMEEHTEELQGRSSGDLEWRLARGEVTVVAVEGEAAAVDYDYTVAKKFIPVEVTKPTSFPTYDNDPNSLIRDNSMLRHGLKSSFSSPLSPTETAVHPDQTSFHMKLYPVQRVITPNSDAAVVGSGTTDVTIIRNDTQSSRTKPTFTSELMIIPTVQQQLELRVIDGYICSGFTSIVYPPPSTNIDTWLSAMTQRCLADSSTLGLSIISRPDGTLSHVMFFENSGYPLLPAALKRADGAEASGSNAKTMAKCFVGAINDSSLVSIVPSQIDASCSSSSSVVRRNYYYLGGGHHEDTSSFDSSEFPASLLKSFPAEVQLVLKQIVVYAGKSKVDSYSMSSSKAGHDCDPLLCYFHYMTTGVQLVNGLQCVFDVLDARTGELLRPGLTFKSPTFTSNNDDPHPFVWTINDSSHYPLRGLKGHSFDRITSIVVKHGALIDSIFIETLHGKRFRAGGSGGGCTTKVKLRT